MPYSNSLSIRIQIRKLQRESQFISSQLRSLIKFTRKNLQDANHVFLSKKLSDESCSYLQILKCIASKKCGLPRQSISQKFVKDLLELLFESLGKTPNSYDGGGDFQDEDIPQQIKLALNYCSQTVLSEYDCNIITSELNCEEEIDSVSTETDNAAKKSDNKQSDEEKNSINNVSQESNNVNHGQKNFLTDDQRSLSTVTLSSLNDIESDDSLIDLSMNQTVRPRHRDRPTVGVENFIHMDSFSIADDINNFNNKTSLSKLQSTPLIPIDSRKPLFPKISLNDNEVNKKIITRNDSKPISNYVPCDGSFSSPDLDQTIIAKSKESSINDSTTINDTIIDTKQEKRKNSNRSNRKKSTQKKSIIAKPTTLKDPPIRSKRSKFIDSTIDTTINNNDLENDAETSRKISSLRPTRSNNRKTHNLTSNLNATDLEISITRSSLRSSTRMKRINIEDDTTLES
ncbi:RING finger protein nhl-1 [Sarcoptes scabiei]|nr:RING finger protein nhl-1 [Sarcoptes scabiei]